MVWGEVMWGEVRCRGEKGVGSAVLGWKRNGRRGGSYQVWAADYLIDAHDIIEEKEKENHRLVLPHTCRTDLDNAGGAPAPPSPLFLFNVVPS